MGEVFDLPVRRAIKKIMRRLDATVIALPPAPIAAAPRSRKFIVAKSLRHAASTAEIDWKWRRVRARDVSWIDAAGDVVRYCGGVRDLLIHGRTIGGVIYLGFAWYENAEYRDLRDHAAAARFDLVEFADALKAGPAPDQGES